MKGKTILAAIAILIAVGVIAIALLPKGTANQYTPTQTTTDTPTLNGIGNGEVQEATLKIENYKYVVTPSTLKAGIPVRMTVDLNTVTGCTRSVTIPAFGVNKRVSNGDNVITFTPLKTGTIKMSCSMGMATGSFTVVADDSAAKTASPTINAVGISPVTDAEQKLPSGGSCGSGGGGCGCGG